MKTPAEAVYTLYAESVRDRDHLQKFQQEVRTIVAKALAAAKRRVHHA